MPKAEPVAMAPRALRHPIAYVSFNVFSEKENWFIVKGFVMRETIKFDS